MKKQSSPIIEQATIKKFSRNPFWDAAILFFADIAYVALVFFYIYLTRTGFELRTIILLIIGFLVGATSIGAMLAIHKNRLEAAGVMMLSVSFFWALIVSSLVEGLGIVLGLTVLFATLSISNLTLPKHWITWSILLGVLISMLSGLMVFYPIFQQLEVPSGQLFTIGSSSVIVVFLLLTLLQFQNFSLTSKLIVFFLIVTLVVGSTVAAFSLVVSRRIVSDSVGVHIRDLAQSQALTIGTTISQQIDSLLVLRNNELLQSNLIAINQGYPNDPMEIQQLLNDLDNQWRAADEAGNNNDPLVKSHLENEIADELLKYVETFPNNVEVFITDVYGGLVGSSQRTSDYYQADEGWWQSAYANGNGAVYISQPEFDKSANQMSVLISLPLYKPHTQEIIGILRTTYAASQFPQILASTTVGKTGFPDLIFADNNILQGGIISQLDQNDLEIFDRAKNNLYLQGLWSNTPSLISVSPVSSLTNQDEIMNLGWYVVFHQNNDEALTPVADQNQLSLVITIFSVGIVSLIAVGLAQILSRPISRLTSVTEKVGSGDLTIRASIESEDEIGTLSKAFNQMTDRLQETLQSLEKRVAERTMVIETSAEISHRLSTILDQRQLVFAVVEEIHRAFNYYHAQIYLFDEWNSNLVMVGGTGEAGRILLAQGHTIPTGKGLVGRAASTNAIVLVPDTSQDANWLPNPLLPETLSEIAVPIAMGDRVLGVIDVQHNSVNGVSQIDSDLLSSIAAQVAVALQNAQNYTNAQRQAERETIINTIGQRIQAATTIEDVLQLTIRELNQTLNTAKASIQISGRSQHNSS